MQSWVREENRKMDMRKPTKASRVERTPKEEERGKIRHRGQERQGEHMREEGFSNWSRLLLPAVLSLYLCPGCLSERRNCSSPSPQGTIHPQKYIQGPASAVERFLCHFFHFASVLVSV